MAPVEIIRFNKCWSQTNIIFKIFKNTCGVQGGHQGHYLWPQGLPAQALFRLPVLLSKYPMSLKDSVRRGLSISWYGLVCLFPRRVPLPVGKRVGNTSQLPSVSPCLEPASHSSQALSFLYPGLASSCPISPFSQTENSSHLVPAISSSASHLLPPAWLPTSSPSQCLLGMWPAPAHSMGPLSQGHWAAQGRCRILISKV